MRIEGAYFEGKGSGGDMKVKQRKVDEREWKEGNGAGT